MTALASAYQRRDPGVQLVLLERADTLARQALVNQDVDIAALSWLPPDALPEGSWHAVFARDGLAVIVNPQNGLPGVTTEQLQQLFQDRLEDWTSWEGRPGAPKLVTRSEASGDYAFFQQRVMGNARVALTALLAPSTDAMLNLVAEDPLAVGYVPASRVDGRVRTLTVDGVPPAPEAIAAGLYPLTRAYYLAMLAEPQGAARAFTQWVLSPEGQAILQRQGLLEVGK
jgi:phosphate transport system substrate-binding protein